MQPLHSTNTTSSWSRCLGGWVAAVPGARGLVVVMAASHIRRDVGDVGALVPGRLVGMLVLVVGVGVDCIEVGA